MRRKATSNRPNWAGLRHAAVANARWVANVTHVATCRYFIHVVIDRFAARIAGWRGSSTLRTDLALNDLEQVVYKRGPDKGGS